jgi:uncharacterized protein involved in outer membrane biogenesis
VHKALISFLVVLIVLTGAVASAVLWIDGERLRNLAIGYIERGGRAELEIERVERTVGLSPRIEIHNLRLRQPEFPDSPLLKIEYAAFDVDLFSFIFEPVTLREVVVESPMVVLPVADEGLLYWGPVIADLIERLRRFDWSIHGFSVVGLEVEALHTVRDARVLLTAASIEGAMPQVADLTLHMRAISGDLRAALALPINGTLVLDEARLRHTDAELPVILEADGHIGSRPLSLRARSANVMKDDSNTRGALEATLELGASTLHVNGTASRGAAPHFDLGFDIAVKELEHLRDSDVRFRLRDEGLAWNVSEIDAVVGDATASGELRIERRDPRPLLTGALQLAGFTFGPSREGGDAAAEPQPSPTGPSTQRDASRAPTDNRRAASSELFRLAIERLDRLDAKLDIRADASKLFGVPIERLAGEARLTDGRLQLAPVDAVVLGGAAGASLSLANQGEPPRFELTTSFGGVETSELAAALGIDHEVFGELQGSLELSSSASDYITGGAAGSATLLMSGGRLSAALAQLVDMDFAARILSTFKKHDETTPIRCAIADFEGHNGIFESQALVVDTGEVKLVGAGTINLAERTIDLVIRPYDKDFSLLSSDAPLRVTGRLSKPDVSPDKGAMALSLLTPIEIGRADNADCQALIQWAGDAMTDSARRSAARRNRR